MIFKSIFAAIGGGRKPPAALGSRTLVEPGGHVFRHELDLAGLGQGLGRSDRDQFEGGLHRRSFRYGFTAQMRPDQQATAGAYIQIYIRDPICAAIAAPRMSPLRCARRA